MLGTGSGKLKPEAESARVNKILRHFCFEKIRSIFEIRGLKINKMAASMQKKDLTFFDI